jgi:hypothetical protein
MVYVLTWLAVQVAPFDTSCSVIHVTPSLEPANTNDLGALVGFKLHAVIVKDPRVC